MAYVGPYGTEEEAAAACSEPEPDECTGWYYCEGDCEEAIYFANCEEFEAYTCPGDELPDPTEGATNQCDATPVSLNTTYGSTIPTVSAGFWMINGLTPGPYKFICTGFESIGGVPDSNQNEFNGVDPCAFVATGVDGGTNYPNGCTQLTITKDSFLLVIRNLGGAPAPVTFRLEPGTC